MLFVVIGVLKGGPFRSAAMFDVFRPLLELMYDQSLVNSFCESA